jgi:hypothetical protein
MNERELTDSEVKRFLSDVEAICIEENISLQNCKVWRHTSGRVAPVRGFPMELRRDYPQVIPKLLKICNRHGIRLSTEHFCHPHEPNTLYVTMALR